MERRGITGARPAQTNGRSRTILANNGKKARLFRVPQSLPNPADGTPVYKRLVPKSLRDKFRRVIALSFFVARRLQAAQRCAVPGAYRETKPP